MKKLPTAILLLALVLFYTINISDLKSSKTVDYDLKVTNISSFYVVDILAKSSDATINLDEPNDDYMQNFGVDSESEIYRFNADNYVSYSIYGKYSSTYINYDNDDQYYQFERYLFEEGRALKNSNARHYNVIRLAIFDFNGDIIDVSPEIDLTTSFLVNPKQTVVYDYETKDIEITYRKAGLVLSDKNVFDLPNNLYVNVVFFSFISAFVVLGVVFSLMIAKTFKIDDTRRIVISKVIFLFIFYYLTLRLMENLNFRFILITQLFMILLLVEVVVTLSYIKNNKLTTTWYILLSSITSYIAYLIVIA